MRHLIARKYLQKHCAPAHTSRVHHREMETSQAVRKLWAVREHRSVAPTMERTRQFHSSTWSEHVCLLIHSQTSQIVYNFFSHSWTVLRMSNQPEPNLSRWSTWRNKHYRWHTSCKAKQDVPPVRPAKVWGPKHVTITVWAHILWSQKSLS